MPPLFYARNRASQRGYSLVLCPEESLPEGYSSLFYVRKRASLGGFSLFYAQKEASQGGFSLFYAQKRPPGGVLACFMLKRDLLGMVGSPPSSLICLPGTLVGREPPAVHARPPVVQCVLEGRCTGWGAVLAGGPTVVGRPLEDLKKGSKRREKEQKGGFPTGL